MKINWGTGLVIALAAFICFIMYFVITMMTDSQYNHDLVVEEYYKQELGFQDQLNAEKNAFNFPFKVRVEESATGINLVFPEEIAEDMQNAKVYFYRVSDKNMDFEKEIVLINNKMQIPEEQIFPGRWDITVQWEKDGKSYLTKEKINF